MRKIVVSQQVEEALRSYNYRTVQRGMVRKPPNPDGSVTLELADDVFARLLTESLPGESIEETLLRLTGDMPGVQ